jgi:phosphoglycolate phosphatase-like HAD superfamily hydrolase
MATILVLWDIDHTLIETRGVGGEIYAEAFRAATGHPLDKMPALAGRTEPVIFREALKAHGIAASEDLYSRFADEQARGYAARADEMRRRGRALPGAADALRALAGRQDVIQSILTGNTRPVAEIKLRTFGLDRYLDLDVGAYGTDDDDRANLVKVAPARRGSSRRPVRGRVHCAHRRHRQRRGSRARWRSTDHRCGNRQRQYRGPRQRRSRHGTRRPDLDR